MISVLIIIASLVLLVYRRKAGFANQRYHDPIQREGYFS